MSLDDALGALIRTAVQDAVREELARLREDLKPAQRAGLPRYLSPDEAAAIAGVTPDTVRYWVSEKRLARYGAGRLVRVKLDDLEAFLRRSGDDVIDDATLDAQATKILRGRGR